MNNNNYQNQKIRGLKRKCEYILAHGGKCAICGYNKNIAAIEFHHLNPQEKEFQIDARKFANCELSKLEKELDKCIIVCSNCHRELHNKDLDLKLVQKLTETVDKNSFNNKFGQECPVCGKRFLKSTGKKFCSAECRKKALGMDKYPSKKEIDIKYQELNS